MQTGGGGGAAACDTVNVWLAMVIVPLRAAPPFAAALKDIDPFPVPDAPDVTVSQSGLFEAAVHAHVGLLAVTATVPTAPVLSMDWLGGAIE